MEVCTFLSMAYGTSAYCFVWVLCRVYPDISLDCVELVNSLDQTTQNQSGHWNWSVYEFPYFDASESYSMSFLAMVICPFGQLL